MRYLVFTIVGKDKRPRRGHPEEEMKNRISSNTSSGLLNLEQHRIVVAHLMALAQGPL